MKSMNAGIDLKVTEAFAEDVGKGMARLGPEDINSLKAVLGDIIEIGGERTTVARITGTSLNHKGNN